MKFCRGFLGLILLALLQPCAAALFKSFKARSLAAAQLPDPHCATGVLSTFRGGKKSQVCCAGYCGECSDYPTCQSVKGQDSTNACCAGKVFEMRCGKAPANVCLKSCSEALPPCIMELAAPPKFHTRSAATDCNRAVKDWRLKAAAAQSGKKQQSLPSSTAAKAKKEKLDEIIDDAAKAVSGLGEFSILVGDANGIRYAHAGKEKDSSGWEPSSFTKPQWLFSAGKWLTAATLGAAVKQGVFSWDDRVGKYINWWTEDPDDHRVNITFKDCMSFTSNLVASKFFGGEDVGGLNDAYTLEETAKLIFDKTKDSIEKPSEAWFRYGETHIYVAEYAALQASGIPTWQDFAEKYFGGPLSLEREIEDKAHKETKSYFVSKSPYAYGFHMEGMESLGMAGKMRRTGARQANNPDMGAQLLMSPCAYSRFLASYIANGEMMWGKEKLDKEYATGCGGTADDFKCGAKAIEPASSYALGHWKITKGPLKSTMHSIGAGGVLPMVVSQGDNPFWLYVNRYGQYGNSDPSLELAAKIMPDLLKFMESPPSVDRSTCPP